MDAWALTDAERGRAQELIDGTKPQTTTLKKLYGGAWADIAQPNEFGMRFKSSVEAGQLQGIQLAGRTSANALLYAIRGG